MRAYSARKAFVVGVGRYAAPQYDLSYARSDAEAMADLLSNEFGFEQVWTLYDNDATRRNLIRFFEQDLQRTDEDDGLLIFFAGHGLTITSALGDDRGFLMPHDGDPKERYSNISLASIRDDYLPNIPAKHVFLVVDACYGGLALRDVATVDIPQSVDESVVAELTRSDHKVRQVLAAGTKQQRVLDGGLFGHSVFTGRLIEALREADPYITADHIGVHVRERVARDSADRKHRQTPQFGYLFGDGSFLFQRGATAETAAERQSSRQRTPPDPQASQPHTTEAPQKYWVAVTSEPQEAEVIVSGQCQGPTPLSLSLPRGQHVLTLVKPGFEQWRKRVVVGREDGHVHVRLLRKCRRCGEAFLANGDDVLCPKCEVARSQDTEPLHSQYHDRPQSPNRPTRYRRLHRIRRSSPKSKWIAVMLAFLFGPIGVHNFYLGYDRRAIAQLLITTLTCGWGLVITIPWYFIEMILLIVGGIAKDGQGRVL